MRNPILVALDVADRATALRLVDQLVSMVGGFKVGKELFVREGPDLVRHLRSLGAHVFLDLKFHDIPHTVARAVAAATELDVQMMTLHTSGGRRMLDAAVQAARDTASRCGRTPPTLLGVTVLTSFEQADLVEVGVDSPVARQVERLAGLAVTAELGGIVCSPLEIAFLRAITPPVCQLVTPGIRMAPPGDDDDQRRTLSAAEALMAGADWLVIGRPIYAASDPRHAVKEILDSCNLPSRPGEGDSGR